MPTISDHIIDALGGTTVVSRLAETPLSTVHSWRKNGIPQSRMAHLRLIAKDEGIQIDWATGERIEHAECASADQPAVADRNIDDRSTPVASALA